MYGIDTSHDKSRDFDLMSLTFWLTLTAKFSLTIDKMYFLRLFIFKQFTITNTTTNWHCLPNFFFDFSETMTNLDIASLDSDVTLFKPPGLVWCCVLLDLRMLCRVSPGLDININNNLCKRAVLIFVPRAQIINSCARKYRVCACAYDSWVTNTSSNVAKTFLLPYLYW
jgi:hypothetical protein